MPATSSTFSAERANEMYWSSPRTVEDIARELNVSRTTFYSSVQPIGAGSSCPVCGEAMVFTNRSNREAGLATCLQCPPGGEYAPSEEVRGERQLAGADSDDSDQFGEPFTRWRSDLAAVTPQRAAMVGSAAALGVVVGAAATRMLREMK